MPKTPKDYSKGLIYKLCCKDPTIKEIYVGSTTNFTQRKRGHKSDCCNININRYNFKVYQFIRENGGFQNWNMVLIEYFPCETELELCRKEDYWKQELQSSLNSNKPHIYETHQEYTKNVYLANKEVILEQKKEYYEKNKERKAIYYKEHYEKNKEKYKEHYEKNKEKNKEHYQANREKILEKQKQKYTCECGCIVGYSGKARHEKSAKHKTILEKQNPLGQDIQEILS